VAAESSDPGGAVAAETSNAATAEAADAATAETSKMASAEAADVAASAKAADVAAAKAAMTTAETATTGVRCEGHERNCEQQHRGSGDAGLQHRPHVSEFSQFRFCDRRYRCKRLRVAEICRR
jgi:hypothetical protein